MHPQKPAKPSLNRLFAWIDEQFDKQGSLPGSAFLKAPAYIRERRIGLFLFLHDPEISIDINILNAHCASSRWAGRADCLGGLSFDPALTSSPENSAWGLLSTALR